MFPKLKSAVAALALTSVFAGAAAARDLVINFDDLNPGPKKGFEDAVAKFKEENPDINVIVNINDREAHKTAIRNFLTADAPDVTSWYPGNRMAPFVEAGLFTPVTDLWQDNGFKEDLAAIMPTMSRDGEIWGVPYSYYQWGIYYRKDIFDILELEEPQTWDELLAACGKMKEQGVTPFTIGTKFLWTAGGWFDYLNMRTNGYDFHMALTAGEVEWTDERVRATFENWATLIKMGAFIDDHQTYSWQEALPFMVNGEAAAYLMGNFAVAPLREAGLDDSKLDFYQFPAINPDVELAEDAPTDTFHIPSNAANKEAAKEFLKFVVSANVQTEINNGENLGQLPVNASSSIDDDKFLNEGFEMLSSNSPGGVAQFFDRDFPAEMAAEAMQGLQEFMVFPDNLDDILARLEKVRERVYQ